ncbi:zinc finger protein ZAT1-like [Canna indica]|uniref:Zinc finger protein ZAT1-like n=1 Tax=Canna indica TaxID=4628 RepID=A0AAQ3Q8W1_9LILI|nr:zinc finger protein ZAT1-like [Canna indica]
MPFLLSTPPLPPPPPPPPPSPSTTSSKAPPSDPSFPSSFSPLSLLLCLIFFLIILYPLFMSMMMDQHQAEQYQQQQTYKHYCRICKKGFGCGRALGGHMRAHGIIDESTSSPGDADDDTSGYGAEWDDKLNNSAGTKRMYALRTNPNRLKSCRICENCGKEFLSWKSFLEHGKCNSDDDGDEWFPSSPRSDGGDDDDLVGQRGCAAWSKGKRSRRTKVVMSEEEDLANCLVMLSSARVEPVAFIETEESCASASKEDDRRKHTIAIAATATETAKAPSFVPPPLPSVPRGMFECKACKKVFSSHQALGGHRASHKKVKGCFAAKLDALDEASPPLEEEIITHEHKNAGEMASAASMSMAIVPFENAAPLPISPLKKKSKVHECSICHRVFTSGQALGGHKRCHWITSNSPDPNLKLHALPDHASLHHQLTLRPMFDASSSEPLDLNMPAPADDMKRDIGSSLRLEMPASIYLRSWIDGENVDKNRETSSSEKNNDINNLHSKDNNTEIMSSFNVDDEVDSKVKLQKLSELKDINMGGESSPWLQVGIGSTSANEGSEPP